MIVIIPILAAVLAACCVWPLCRTLNKQGRSIPWITTYLTFVLPFATGGFYTCIAAVTAILLLVYLISLLKQQNHLRCYLNLNSIAVIAVVAGYCITPLWAADRGMAVFGILRYLPLFLFVLVMMQYTPVQKQSLLSLVPLCGACMTVISLILLLIPGADTFVAYRGRLCGFFQYPNTFAAFLLAGLILQGTSESRRKADWIVNAILILGILLSGSRTSFILLIPALIGIAVVRRSFKTFLPLIILVVCGLAAAIAVSSTGLLKNADRFTTISLDSKSLTLRLLYFRDALPIILRNPFGLGYMGYRALEGSFQTGNYSVSYVHNGLLQLLLDIGWIPSLLILAAFLRALFTPHLSKGNKLLLLVMLSHCMMDFDLQYFIIWVIILSVLDFESGKQFNICVRRYTGSIAGIIISVICMWLGLGTLCYTAGYPTACLAITPFHTEALTASLVTAATTSEADAIADRILDLNSSCSIAYSAKANYALSQGKIVIMMEYKEQAISTARHSVTEYIDYFEKLYAVIQLYQQAGDYQSAAYCLEKLLTIPDMMAQVSSSTSYLAECSGTVSALELPEEYQEILNKLIDRS